MNFTDFKLRLHALLRPNREEQDLRDELAFHIERETKKLIDEGMPPNEARMKAQARFGSTTVTADECRDERGTATVDNTLSDIQYALRTFKRAPLAALTIVVTVALGLGVVATVFTILNTFLYRLDNVPNIAEIYEVEQQPQANAEEVPFARPRFEAMRAETSVFTEAYAALNNVDLRVDGQMMVVNLVSSSFFDVVRVMPAMGRAISAADDDRAGGNPVIVLSHRGWESKFKRDPNVIGRTVLVAGAPFEIIGVMPEGFRGLEVSAPHFWAPLARVADFIPKARGSEEQVGIQIAGRLRPGVSMESARAQLAAWHTNQSASTGADRTLSIVLLPKNGTIPNPMETVAMFTPLFLAFGLILLIGCANVANLLLARGVARQKEIGIRLSLGASRRRIVRQLMTESVLLALAAAAGGYVISRVALEGAVSWMMRRMPMDLGEVNLGVPAADWRVAAFLIIVAVLATAFFALMPALQATRVEPVRTLRGELVKDAKPGRARNVLIGVQVFASALLLICASIFLRSSMASAQFNPGLRTADTILIDIDNEEKRAELLRTFATEPTLAGYAGVRPMLLGPPPRGFADTGAGKKPISFKFVSDRYFDVLGIPIVSGRAFTAAERDDHLIAVVSETMARELWPNGPAVGETFRLEPDLTPQNPYGLQVNPDSPAVDITKMTPRVVTVVGVARDVAGFRLTDVKEAGVYLPTNLDVERTSVVARINGEPDLARQILLERLTKVDPNLGQIITMRTVARLERLFLDIAFSVSLVLGGLALLLTVSGLFSVLSYLVEQRTREIGVRMALGASSHNVTQLMLSQTTRPVIFGLISGAGLSIALATALLSSEAGALISTIVRVTDPIAYLSSLMVIVAACLVAAWVPASRASKLDPMKTLRQE